VIELIVSSGLLHFIYRTRTSYVPKGPRWPRYLSIPPVQHFSQCLLGYGVACRTKWGRTSSCCSHISRLMCRRMSNDSDSLTSRKRWKNSGCLQLFKYIGTDELVSNNILPKAHNKFLWKYCLVCAWAKTKDQTCEARVLVIFVSVEPDLASECNFLMELLLSQNPATKFYTRVIFVVDPAEFAVFDKFSPTCSWRTPTRTSGWGLWWDCVPLSRVGLCHRPNLFSFVVVG